MNSASMSSNFYAFDAASFLRHSSSVSDMVSSDAGGDLFFSDPLPFPLNGVVHEIPNDQTHQHTLQETAPCLDPLSPFLFSSSLPSIHLENLSTYQANPVQSNAPNFETEFRNFSVLDGFKVKSEECQVGLEYDCNQNFVPHSFNGAENVSKFSQRSYSSNCVDGKPGFLFQPHYDTLIDSSNFQALSSPENSFYTGQLRKVCSAGDLQNMISNQTSPKEGSFLEEANFKVGRYSAEERKERISKYRAKRSQRNFNKTIKYACRKTLADNRPRIRGRFARNDEAGENMKAPCSARDEDEDDLWFGGLLEEQEDITVKAEQYVKGYSPQFQYYGF